MFSNMELPNCVQNELLCFENIDYILRKRSNMQSVMYQSTESISLMFAFLRQFGVGRNNILLTPNWRDVLKVIN